MTFNYFPNVPNAPNDPADDQPEMQVNTLSIQNLIAVDHVGFNAIVNSIPNSGGFHKVVHFITQNADPAAILTIGQVYTKSVTFNGNTDECLFYESGGGRITQLTTVDNVLSATEGYAFLAGGILMQWGRVSGVTTSITYSVPFSANAYSIQLTVRGSQASSSARSLATVATSSTVGFTMQIANNSDFTYSLTYWLAIGPV